MPRIVRPDVLQHRLELATQRQTANLGRSNVPDASHLAASSPNPQTPRNRPSFVTRYRPPAPTHCTHPSPIHRRNNRLKFFPLAPNGSPPPPLTHPPAHPAPPSAAVHEPTDQPLMTVSPPASFPTPPLRPVPR